tara:strand:+ start:3961 stop:4119 length:159 start_codon:yes stop_codon:yes gene_type:complete
MKHILLFLFIGINGCTVISPDVSFSYELEDGSQIGVTFNKLIKQSGKNPISK